MDTLLWNRVSADAPLLILAHGAGAPMDSEFMASLAGQLSARGVSVVRFEFPYMQQRRESGGKRPPNRAPQLLESFREVLHGVDARHVYIGGKSMGGRMASLLACEEAVAGVIAFGYPFVPPGKDRSPRIAHFPEMKAPLLICQGERDPFGGRDQVGAMGLAIRNVSLAWIADGDHDFKPRKRSGHEWAENMASAADAAATFIFSRKGK